MADILVIGQSGMLGRAWASVLDTHGHSWQGLSRPVVDLQDRASIDAAITPGTQWVINCAGWTLVDLAEEHAEEANAVNGTAVTWIAERCKIVGASLVQYSTDYVFDGKAREPYPIDHPRSPVNVYGHSKALGEEALEDSGVRHLLIRTSWVYAPWGKNFVRSIARAAMEGKPLRIVDDQRGCPSSALHVASTTLSLLERDQTGTFHITDGGSCTWFDLGKAIVEVVNPACPIEPCTTAERGDVAPRPVYSVLDTSLTERLVGPFPGWQAALRPVLSALRSTPS